jgi:hypothetical protein
MTNNAKQSEHQLSTQHVFMADRYWGSEYLILCVPSRYTVKILQIHAGFKGGFQYHHFKIECGLILNGKLEVCVMDKNQPKTYILHPNDFFFFPRGLIHQERAIEETVIFEASTPHFNDRVRIDNDYNNQLSSTLPSEVLEITSNNELHLLSEYGFQPSTIDQVPFVHLVNIYQ